MIDLYHYIGSDLSISPTGDLLTASDTPVGQQRVVRRLLTNQWDYIWQGDYGAGVGALIGTPADATRITAVIRANISKEAAVSPTPTPTITVQADQIGNVTATILYADAVTGQSQVLTVPLG